MKKVVFVSFALLAVWAMGANAQEYTEEQKMKAKAEVAAVAESAAMDAANIKYPYKFKYEGNPLSRIHGAADPDVNVWDGTVWMYTSHDRNRRPELHKANYDSMDGYHAFSTKDMINWTDHGLVFHSKDIAGWGWQYGGFMWAPGAAKANGKYYLYFPHRDSENKWRIGVAVADKPQGPFKDTGKPLEGIGGIDPKIFIDTDGQAYIYNNSAIIAKLKPSMLELAEPTRKIVYGTPEQMKDSTSRFSEGSYMHKKDGKYYYSWTCLKNKTHHGHYAMGDNPYGPFEYKGPMAPRPQGAQDHHSIIEFKGQWYYFYHIGLKNFPIQKEGQGRIACYDKLFYNPDGTIRMVEHTRDANIK